MAVKIREIQSLFRGTISEASKFARNHSIYNSFCDICELLILIAYIPTVIDLCDSKHIVAWGK